MKQRILSIALLAAATGCMQVLAAESRAPSETAEPKFSQALPNVAGKTFSSAIVTFPPGASSAPHRHGQAFVYAYVLSGTVRSGLDGGAWKVFRAGDDWVEPPGTRHTLAENASASEPAKLLVIFVADTGEPLKLPDEPSR